MRPRRSRHHFHTFALDEGEEEVLNRAKKITGQGLTDTLITAVRTYVKNNNPDEEDEPKSFFEFLKEVYRRK